MPIGRRKKPLFTLPEDLPSRRRILCPDSKGVAGVESATELTEKGFEKVMERFQEMGFKEASPDPISPYQRGGSSFG
jgi:hypothetical protein